MLQKAASDQGLHILPLMKFFYAPSSSKEDKVQDRYGKELTLVMQNELRCHTHF